MNKKALSLAVCLAISYSSTSYGLGLGEIESSSHLNQPFRAKINLLSTSVSDAKRLKIRIASPEVFSRVGIERPEYLDSISFTSTVENGKPVIMVSSNQPISQPFLNFLIEVSWPNGQLLKEYTVLLDPPVLVQAGTAVAKNTVGVRAEPQQQLQNVTPSVTQTDRASATRKQTIASRTTPVPNQTSQVARKSNQTSKYRVVSGDTLTKIAKKLRRRGVRDEQMMIALFRANPTAFRKRNINNLKAGSLMRRPSVKDARQLNYRDAKAAVYNQSQQWRNYRAKLAQNTVPQQQIKPNNKGISTPTPAPKNTQARLEVIGSSSSGLDAKTLSATGSAKVGQLERELIQARESLAAKANANIELKSRVSELESLLRKKNRLITLKNEQLAELQAKLGMPAAANNDKTIADEGSDIGQQVKNSASEGEGIIVRSGKPNDIENSQQTPTEDPAVATTNTGTEGEKEQQLAVVDSVSTDIPSIFDKEAEDIFGKTSLQTPESSDKSVETVGSPQNPTTDDEGILGLLGSPLALGLGGSALLALLFGFLMRRKGRSGENEKYSAIDFNDPEFAPGSNAKNEKQVEKDTSKDAFAGLDGGFDDLDFGDTLDTKNNKQNSSPDIDTDDDILQEADVYIVYGLHDQAEVELKKAIEKHPNNLHYHAKLLENYQASSNVEAFDKQAKNFSTLADDAEGNKEKLWKKITGWAQNLKSESTLFTDNSSSKITGAGAIAAAAVAGAGAGGVAVTAGKAFAADKQDDISDLLDGLDNQPENSTANDIDLAHLAKTDDTGIINTPSTIDSLDLNDLGFDLNDKSEVVDNIDFNSDDLDLDDILGKDSADDSSKMIETVSADLDDTSLDDLLNDVETTATKVSPLANPIVEEQETELGAEFEDLLDLDLSDLSDDLSGNHQNYEMSNLNLELNNDNDLNKILPTGSPYTSAKDDVAKSDNLLGDLDDDLSFMDLDGSDDDLKETQVSTKLDLARAYLDMGDMEGARNTLEEVMMEGNDDQKKEAEELLHQTG